MARSIGFENDETFRAVTVLRYPKTDRTVTKREGPYATRGPARARVSYWRNRFQGYSTEWVDGWIERTVNNWERE